MDDPKNHQRIGIVEDRKRSAQNRFDFDSKNYENSRNFLIDMVKFSLFFGADKVLMTRKQSLKQPSEACERKNKDIEENEKVCGKYPSDDTIVCNEDFVDVSKVVNCPSLGYNEFPLNFIAFLAILVLKLVGFQIGLVISFFTLPIWLSYTTFMFFMFPFQTLARIRNQLTKRLLRMWGDLYLSITSLIFTCLKARKSVLNLATRFGLALFWSMYVYFVLVGLLVSGFVLGGLTMRRLVEKPVHSTDVLNFDYTKPSPDAFVPIMSSPGGGIYTGLIYKDGAKTMENVGVRAIPSNHKLLLSVSLTLPESEYNRNLGIFQVRVEFQTANGKVTTSSSQPCMLKFKSQPIRLVEIAFKSIPLLAGFQSEAQTLNVQIHDFIEGYEPTACLKVILEQRAEYQSGAGIPQIYTSSLSLESQLPKMKKMIWYWRRTIFVWISLMSFLTELLVVLILFRPIIMPRGRAKMGGDKKRQSLEQNFVVKNVVFWRRE